MLDGSSVTRRPSEKWESPVLRWTDAGLQASLPEINTGANHDSGVLLCGREGGDAGLWAGEHRRQEWEGQIAPLDPAGLRRK